MHPAGTGMMSRGAVGVLGVPAAVEDVSRMGTVEAAELGLQRAQWDAPGALKRERARASDWGRARVAGGWTRAGRLDK